MNLKKYSIRKRKIKEIKNFEFGKVQLAYLERGVQKCDILALLLSERGYSAIS